MTRFIPLVALIAAAIITTGQAAAETATLQIININPRTGSYRSVVDSVSYDLTWSDRYDNTANECASQVTFEDGTTADAGDDYYYNQMFYAEGTRFDPTTYSYVPNAATRITADCTLTRTVHYWQRYVATDWRSVPGSAFHSRSGDCRSYIYLQGTLTIDCRGARRGETATWYIRHRGTANRCVISFSLAYSTPGARRVTCKRLSARVASVVFFVAPGGRFTVTEASVRYRYNFSRRETEIIDVPAHGEWNR